MKFKKYGQILLALVVSLGLGFGLTSCANDYTVAYLYVTGGQYNQIAAYKIASNTGNLLAVSGTPYGSGGSNPVRALVSTTGRFLYVLNEGKATTDASGNTTYASANISVFSVGGDGVLAFQQSYSSQGYGSFRFAISGSYLYVLDEYAPYAGGVTGSTSPLSIPQGLQLCQDSSGIYHPTGDITAFSINNTTGRLSLITNAQVTNPSGGQLTYFPVGCEPIDLLVTSAYALSADTSDPVTGNKYTVFPYAVSATSGQLTTTQNTEFVTGAQSISALSANQSRSYIYILDPLGNNIWYYTIGSNGLLQSVNGSPTSNSLTTSGNPIQLTSDSRSKFLYVANAGPSSTLGQASSDITGYIIASNGVLSPTAPGVFPSGSGPQCIIEDPSNQYIYTADYNSNTVTGHVLDPSSGLLTDLRNQSSYPTVGNPTWCIADGHTD